MIISTPRIDDMGDSNTVTMNNTRANAQIIADFAAYPNHVRPATSSPASSNITATLATEKELQPTRKISTSSEGYVSRVGFDTLGCDDTSEYAFTLQSKTDNWRRTKYSRTFLVGTDLNDYSAHALQWVMNNMVEDGDEIVALRVVPVDFRDALSKSGIPSFQGQESAARQEALKLMTSICERNVSNKEISIVVECMVGNVRDTIQYMIKLYQPDMLVVGTRGRSSVKGFLLGSVSRYCLNHSSVPVIVVRPERKLNKSKNKSKGIFRRRNSDLPNDNKGYLPHPTQPIHLSTSDFDLRNIHTHYGNSYLSTQSTLFPSATIHAGDRFPGRTNSVQNMRPLSSLFDRPSPPPATTAAAPAATPLVAPSAIVASPPQTSTPSDTLSSPPSSLHSSISLSPPLQIRGPAPPPPDGVLKMKKSLTTDGTGKSIGKSFGRSSGGFLSGSTLLGPLLGKSDKNKR